MNKKMRLYHQQGREAAAEGKRRLPVGARVRITSQGWLFDPVGTVVEHTRIKFKVKLDRFPNSPPSAYYATALVAIDPSHCAEVSVEPACVQRRPMRWTSAEIATLIRMRNAGSTQGKIAAKLGRSLNAVRTMAWQTQHLNNPPGTPRQEQSPLGRANLARIEEMLRARTGATPAKHTVANTLGQETVATKGPTGLASCE